MRDARSVGVAQLAEGHRVDGFSASSLLGERDRLVQPASEERELSEEVVGARSLRILRERLFQLRLGKRLHLEPEHHLRVDDVRRGGVGRDVKRPRERDAGAIRLPRLDVGLTENVAELEVVPRPRTRLLEQRNRVRIPSGQVVGTGRAPASLRATAACPRVSLSRTAVSRSIARG